MVTSRARVLEGSVTIDFRVYRGYRIGLAINTPSRYLPVYAW